MTDPRKPEDLQATERQTNWTIIALVTGLLLVVLIVAYFATSRSSEQDKLTNSEVVASTAPRRDKLCASSSTYDLLKRELFRRAAQLRASDQGAYDKLSAYAVVRMENPVMESDGGSTGAVGCSGSLSLDLPPGVAVAGGRRTLMSEVDYTITAAADGSGTVVLLRNADAIIAPLATLARTSQPPLDHPSVAAPTGGPSATGDSVAADAVPLTLPAPSRPASARPNFDCATARTRGEIAVCGDPGLAALDRQMAAQYSRAFSVASPDERALLRDTGRRFYNYRDGCPSNGCIGDAYTGRMSEIRDIMEGRWQAPR